MINENPELQSFLSHWFKGSTGLIELRLVANGKAKSYFYDSISQIPIEKALSAKPNVYFGVSTRRNENGSKEGVSEVPGLWQDLDGIDYLTGEKQRRARELVDKAEGKGKWKDSPQILTPEEFIELMGLVEPGKDLALKALFELPPHLQPTFVIDTGKGYQAYWKFREPIKLNGSNDRDSIESFNRRLTAFLGADHTTDVSRVFRLPCTRNVKLKGWSLRTEIIGFHAESQFNLSDFDWLPEITAFQKEYREEKDFRNIPLHIPDRFWELLETDSKLKETWEGKRQDLHDNSGSGLDMALAD
ncbi:MAG: hypothetical protein ACM3SR_19270 [Ignavibacteriales bacterium]